jgi:hypothetical protein
MINTVRVRECVDLYYHYSKKNVTGNAGNQNKILRDINYQPINFCSAAIRSLSACSRSIDSVISVMVQ